MVGLEPYAYAPIVAYYLRRNGLHQELARRADDITRRPAFLVVARPVHGREALASSGGLRPASAAGGPIRPWSGV